MEMEFQEANASVELLSECCAPVKRGKVARPARRGHGESRRRRAGTSFPDWPRVRGDRPLRTEAGAEWLSPSGDAMPPTDLGMDSRTA